MIYKSMSLNNQDTENCVISIIIAINQDFMIGMNNAVPLYYKEEIIKNDMRITY